MSTDTPAVPTRPAAAMAKRAITVLLVGLIIGTVTAFIAIAFVETVLWLNDVLLVSAYAKVQSGFAFWQIALITISVPALGGLIVAWMISRAAPTKRPTGPPDVIQAVQLQSGMPDNKSGVVTSLAALISLGAGASVGQYGPMVYIGALIGNQTKRLNLAIPNLSTVSIACGVAAAIAAAFNAPIAGLIFAHEAIVRHYSMQSFAPATVAATSGYVVANVIFDRPPLFLIQPEEILQGSEFLLFALLGLCAAAISILYMRTILRTAKFARELNISPLPRGLIAGVGLGLVTLWLPEITGVGQFTMRFATIDGAFSAFELGGLMLGKIALTAFCLGFGFVGGVFSPALVVGALFGGLFWTLLSITMPDTLSSYSIYVICGMMAVTSPVIGAPLTTILIVFELTRSYDLAIASMIAVVFSNLVTYRFFGRSLFDHQLLMKGVDLSQGRDQARLSDMRVCDYAAEEAPIFSKTTSQQEVLQYLQKTGWNEAYAIDSETQKFIGFLRAVDLEAGSETPIAGKLQISDLSFDETTSVRQAMEKLSSFVGDAIPIIKSSDGSLVGVVTEGAIIQSYLNLAADLRREENAGL